MRPGRRVSGCGRTINTFGGQDSGSATSPDGCGTQPDTPGPPAATSSIRGTGTIRWPTGVPRSLRCTSASRSTPARTSTTRRAWPCCPRDFALQPVRPPGVQPVQLRGLLRAEQLPARDLSVLLVPSEPIWIRSLYAYSGAKNRGNPQWAQQLHESYDYRREHADARPARTFSEYRRVAARPAAGADRPAFARDLNLARPFSQIASALATGNGPAVKYRQVEQGRRQEYAKQASQVHQFREERQRREIQAMKQADRTTGPSLAASRCRDPRSPPPARTVLAREPPRRTSPSEDRSQRPATRRRGGPDPPRAGSRFPPRSAQRRASSRWTPARSRPPTQRPRPASGAGTHPRRHQAPDPVPRPEPARGPVAAPSPAVTGKVKVAAMVKVAAIKSSE